MPGSYRIEAVPAPLLPSTRPVSARRRSGNAPETRTLLLQAFPALIQGARYGVALDAIPSQFCAGELEATIVEAFENENPDVIIIEGQGALSHPAFSSTSFPFFL